MATSHEEARRQGKHEKQRAQAQEDMARQKASLTSDSSSSTKKASDRFVGKFDSIEDTLKKSTIGLVSAEDFKKRREELEELKRREAAETSERAQDSKKKKKKNKKDTARPTLSFAMDGEEDAEEDAGDTDGAPVKKKSKRNDAASSSSTPPTRLLKNPTVDTSFLPDRARDEAERRTREQLRQEWLTRQEEIKREPIEITYSYWDGTGHRKTITVHKGDSIAQFLEKCRSQVPELKVQSVDNMMYIKEDLIIPHHHTFYEFIINKARGKSGPLFNFDVHEDIRMVSDATVEKDDSHAGKVVLRQWYRANSHVFPASRWELYEPGKEYGSYSIHDRLKGK